MDSCGDDLQKLLRDSVAESLADLYCAGGLLYAFHKVELVFEKSINQNLNLGRPGQKQSKKIQLIPGPKLDIKTQFIGQDSIVQKIGDAKFEFLPTTYTRELLQGASHWLIDGHEYSLVEGSLVLDPAGFFWSGILMRRKKSSVVAP